ncbi:transcription termination/antitermination protein NusG [Rhizobium leguminosarum]|uniref:transcription termination/antitermination protein NusG n=1 Tax=Rhizobium leguminosarum TaxID=384 RepID=UPI003511737D
MTMQFRKGGLGSSTIVVSAEAWAKRDKAAGAKRLRIDHLNMASRGAVERLAKDTSAPKPGWYCLRVMTGRENAVEKCLNAGDVESLVVMTNECKVVRRGRVKIVLPRPVICGYVLVFCSPIPAATMGLMHVADVIDIVGGAIRPYRADEKSILRFKEMASEGKYDASVRKAHGFMVEENVRVSDGPFASFPGTITEINDEHHRVKVDVMIFGRLTPVDLDIDQIEKI